MSGTAPGAPLPEPAREAADWLRRVLGPGARLSSDSRRIAAGDGFLAWPGARHDARAHLDDALAAGAAAVLWEPEGFDWPQRHAQVAHRPLAGLQRWSGPVAARFFGEPSRRLAVVAVTGTNGKTSCTQWIAQGSAEDGVAAAVVGTLGSGVVRADAALALAGFGLTTPDAVALQAMLAAFAADGASLVALEASSIGLEQGRLDGCEIAVAAFTQLTRDHLDFHGTMQAYAAAKARLFGWPGLRVAVVHGDDPWAPTMHAAVRAGTRRVVTGFEGGAHAALAAEARVVCTAVRDVEDGVAVSLEFRDGERVERIDALLPVLGRFNVANALTVAGCWWALGVEPARCARRLSRLRPVPGRLQWLRVPGRPQVVVDYAHTPDAIGGVLQALRPRVAARGGRLWCVFGAGGDRDRGKRPAMAQAAEAHADRIVLTSDNPRSEDPQAILADLRAGLARPPFLIEPDRAAAIAAAIAAADPRDTVVLAGKGHEDTQEIAGARLPFSDSAVAQAALARTACAPAGARDA